MSETQILTSLQIKSETQQRLETYVAYFDRLPAYQEKSAIVFVNVIYRISQIWNCPAQGESTILSHSFISKFVFRYGWLRTMCLLLIFLTSAALAQGELSELYVPHKSCLKYWKGFDTCILLFE